MMDSSYPASQSYGMYEHPSWGEDTNHTTFVGDDHDSGFDGKALDSVHPADPSSGPESRRPSVLKVEDDFSATAPPSQMWHDQPHESHPARSFSQSHAPMMSGLNQQYMRVGDPTFNTTMQPPHQWNVPHSGASTPTPLYGPVYDMPYAHPAPGYPGYPADPTSAVSMSPQSSQGGWASTTSSDGTDQRGMISPTYRPPSPGTVVRPDGIRKKNARFEIPKERNLSNIDAMILASTDENEKKELKQQKRLLRNRQAALDSRQRKKTHTEKLEQEKKLSEKKLYDLEEALTNVENTLALEREETMRVHQHMESVIQALQYDRDEAIRTKTLETAELRRQNNILKDCVRDLERQQNKGYVPASNLNHFSNDFNDFELEDSWDDELDFISNDDLKMDDHEALQRQATPRPPPDMIKAPDAKNDVGFSWNTFYMCLLFGAFIASNSNNNADSGATTAIASSIPPAEASNVLKTVLNSGGGSNEISSTMPQPTPGTSTDAHVTDMDSIDSSSNLDVLHHSLATPSRRQEAVAAFSMSASSYQHISDPFSDQLVDGPSNIVENSQPTALQKAFANMQAQKDNLDRVSGLGSKARERSLLWDQVPPEVIKNFEAMVQRSASINNDNPELMEQ